MDSSLKNIAVILLIFTFAIGGYYLFIKKDQTGLILGNDSLDQTLFVDVQKYIERRKLLDQVKLDTALFNDQRFRTLTNFSTGEVTQPIGRPNPFDVIPGLSS